MGKVLGYGIVLCLQLCYNKIQTKEKGWSYLCNIKCSTTYVPL